MQVPARLIFRTSTLETMLDEMPKLGDVIKLQTNQGNLRLQIESLTWLNLDAEGLIVELRFYDAPEITFLQHTAPFELFSAYPEIRELGRDRLQAMCSEWITTPVARETGVIEVRVTEELALTIRAALGDSPKADEVYHFPADHLLRFIAENGVASQERDDLLVRIEDNRRRVGVEVYQRFLLTSPASQ